jgi:hypothetical protein
MNNLPFCALSIGYKDQYVEEMQSMLLLESVTDDHWNKKCIDQVSSKLNGASYAVKLMFHLSKINTLKLICFAYFYTILIFGIIYWGNSSNCE